jgi:hypothetical protein
MAVRLLACALCLSLLQAQPVQARQAARDAVHGDGVAAHRQHAPPPVEVPHLHRQHRGAGERFARLVEDMAGDERRVGKDDVGVLERLLVAELDRATWLADPRLPERHGEIAGAAGREVDDDRGQSAQTREPAHRQKRAKEVTAKSRGQTGGHPVKTGPVMTAK